MARQAVDRFGRECPRTAVDYLGVCKYHFSVSTGPTMSPRSVLFATMFVASGLMPGISHSAELRVLSANGMREVMEDLRPKFERATDHRLRIEFATVGAIVQRIISGDSADVVIAPQQGVDRLVNSGKANAG